MGKKIVKKTAGRGSDQYMLRLPEGMRGIIARLAEANGRSINSEIVDALAKHIMGKDLITDLANKVGEMEEMIKELQEITAQHTVEIRGLGRSLP